MNALIPSEAVCLLEYYFLPHEELTSNSPANLESLLEKGLLKMPPTGGRWEITAKGQAHVYNMLQVPLPIQVWQLPTTNHNEQTPVEEEQ